MTKIGNYNMDYINLYFESEGYYDKYHDFSNLSDDAKVKLAAYRREEIV